MPAGSSKKGNRASRNATSDNNEGQDNNERTPLLRNQDSQAGESQHDEEDESHKSDNDSDSDSNSDNDEDTIISDLGDFSIQPGDLAKCIAERDVDGLLELASGSGSSGAGGSTAAFLEALQTDEKKGLSQDQYSEEGSEERTRVYGRNKLPEREMKSFWRFLWEAFCDKVLIILTVAAAISFALGMWQDFGPQHDPEEPRVNWVEGVAIMTAIVIVTVTSSVNDYSKERQFKALSETKEIPKAEVLRDGKKYKTVKSTEIMVGDILHVKAGDVLLCDGLLLSSEEDLKVDESDATGESDAISKTSMASVTGENSQDKKSGKEGNQKKDTDGGDIGNKQKKDKKESKPDPFLLSGSKVLEGKGHFVVIAVGPRSFQGKIFMSLRSSQPDQTRMQKQLASLAETIAKLASIAGGILFLALFIRNCIDLKTKPDRTPAEKGQSFLQSFVISVTLVVVAVPEGLPLAVTLALAFATNRMTSHNLLVRVFEACETMSNANVIVTDKTGTLTANEMTVVEGTIGGVPYTLRSGDDEGEERTTQDDNEEDAKDVHGLIELLKKNEALFDVFAESVAINSTAFEQNKEENSKDDSNKSDQKGKKDKKKQKGNNKQKRQSDSRSNGDAGGENGDAQTGGEETEFVGNKTESALLRMLEGDLAELKKKSYSDYRSEFKTVLTLPFSSDRKAMATAVELEDGGKYRLYVKGAAEAVVALCKDRAQLESDGLDDKKDLDDQYRKKVDKFIENYASRSLRTIAMAYRDFDHWPPQGAGKQEEADGESKIKYDDIAKDLTLIAIPGIQDPLRDGVPKAVEDCHRAGVQVKMCTGDNILTAQAIAQQCHIHDEDDKNAVVISGADWRKLSDEEKREKAPKITVMARSLPQDKQTLVKALQDSGQIVGVTGDGTNDALALKDGDVGFSMGVSGTEVAKEASDVIIMDDNFTTIVRAISWGRCVSDAVRKFLQFQLAVNITAIVITFVSSVTSGEENSIMNAVQLLWVNLIMDTFAALALATDPADDSLLDRKPEPRETPIITVSMVKMIGIQAIYQIAVTLTIHFTGPKILKPIDNHVTDLEFDTLVFNVFVWCQIFNMINCRQLDNKLNVFAGLHRNLWILGILAIMIGGQVLIVFVGGAAFGTTPISPAYWAVSVALGAGSIVIGAIARFIPDAWLGQILIKIGVMPNLDSLPRTRSKRDTGETGDEKVYRYLEAIRGGRTSANSNFHNVQQNSKRGKTINGVKRLLLLPISITRTLLGYDRH